jgi:hypothetical protein
VQRAQQKYGSKLQVVGLSVDLSYGMPREQAQKQVDAIRKRSNVTWPNVFDPQGFNGVMRNFNISGYGLMLIGPDGIVRGTSIRMEEAGVLLDKILKPGTSAAKR